jgi:hypothetical protein
MRTWSTGNLSETRSPLCGGAAPCRPLSGSFDRGVRLAAADAAQQPQVVAEVDDACHLGREHFGARCLALPLQHHALGADAGLDLGTCRRAAHVQAAQHAAVGQRHFGAGARALQHALEHRVVADETGHEAVGGRLVELLHRVELLDHAFVEDRDAVAHGEGFALVVRHVDEGHAELAMQFLQLDLHVFAQLLVERAERLVHQHQLRLEHQGARQRHALLLAAGKLARQPVVHAAQLHHLERALHAALLLVLRHLAHRERVGHVLAHAEMREQGVVLEHHAEVPLVRRRAVDLLAVEQDVAGGRRLEAGQHHQRGGLARARRPEQAQELAPVDVQVELAHHQVLAVVGFLDALEAHQRFLGHGGVQVWTDQRSAAKLSARIARPSSTSKSDAVSGTSTRITLP